MQSLLISRKYFFIFSMTEGNTSFYSVKITNYMVYTLVGRFLYLLTVSFLPPLLSCCWPALLHLTNVSPHILSCPQANHDHNEQLVLRGGEGVRGRGGVRGYNSAIRGGGGGKFLHLQFLYSFCRVCTARVCTISSRSSF